jgi:hypothetical protein
MEADGSPSDRSTRLPARVRATGSLLLATLCWSMLAPLVRMGEGVESRNLQEYLRERGQTAAPVGLEQALRAESPAWSLSYRMFAALAQVNLALEKKGLVRGNLDQVDAILDDTLRLEREQGQQYFLPPHEKQRYFVSAGKRSAFVDGAIAMMIAARQLAAARSLAAQRGWQGPEDTRAHAREPAPREALSDELRMRLAYAAETMEQSSLLCAESYPDTCETLAMVLVLSAMRMLDRLDHTRAHEPLIARWLKVARRKLLDRESGLLIARFSPRRARRAGPEGSSIWLTAHCLQLLDPAFARDQYRRAKRALSSSAFGLAFVREWPRNQGGDRDVAAYMPWREAGTRSTAFALLGAKAFADERQLRDLSAALGLFARPSKTDQALHFSEPYALHFETAGPLGNMVLLYALTQGPLWRTVRGRTR